MSTTTFSSVRKLMNFTSIYFTPHHTAAPHGTGNKSESMQTLIEHHQETFKSEDFNQDWPDREGARERCGEGKGQTRIFREASREGSALFPCDLGQASLGAEVWLNLLLPDCVWMNRTLACARTYEYSFDTILGILKYRSTWLIISFKATLNNAEKIFFFLQHYVTEQELDIA